MAISSLFAKFKGLGPVIVVGGAVLVTIKLLTTKTPTTEESLIVKVEEDIKTDEYKDDIQIPEPEPEPEPEAQPQPPEEQASEDTAEDTEQDEEDEGEQDSPDEAEEKEEKEEQAPQPPPEPPKTQLKFRDTGVGALLGKILKPKKG